MTDLLSWVVRELFASLCTLLTSSLLAPTGREESLQLHDKWWRKWDNLFHSLAFCSLTCFSNCFMLFFLILVDLATTELWSVTAQHWEELSDEKPVKWHAHSHACTDFGVKINGEILVQHIYLEIKFMVQTHTYKHTHCFHSYYLTRTQIRWELFIGIKASNAVKYQTACTVWQQIKHSASFFNHVFGGDEPGQAPLRHPGVYTYPSSCLYIGIWPLTSDTCTFHNDTAPRYSSVEGNEQGAHIHHTNATMIYLFYITCLGKVWMLLIVIIW